MTQSEKIIEKFKWTEHRVQILREMASRKVSSTIIARMVGCTRNAVIGKAARMEIALKAKKGSNTPIKKSQLSKSKYMKNENAMDNPAFNESKENQKTMPELGPNDCRFPIRDNYFCGEKKASHSAYCLDHHLLCHKETNKKESSNALG